MEYKPLSGREWPRFSSIKTFLRLPHVNLDADFDIGICGVPFDGGLTYRPGARMGPTKIREISSLSRSFHWERDVDFTDKLKVADIGDCPIVPLDLNRSYSLIEDYFLKLNNKKKKIVAIGGDHSITLPILRALRKKWNIPLNLIHFDAHLDCYPAAWDYEFHHGSFIRHAVNEKLIDPLNTIQIGVRGPLSSRDDLKFIKEHNIRSVPVELIRSCTYRELVSQYLYLKEGPTYITFDVDCLDPAYAPGTGTPVVGGLTTYEVQQILRRIRPYYLVGCDIVEVSPIYDHADITSLAAIDVLFEFLIMFSLY